MVDHLPPPPVDGRIQSVVVISGGLVGALRGRNRSTRERFENSRPPASRALILEALARRQVTSAFFVMDVVAVPMVLRSGETRRDASSGTR